MLRVNIETSSQFPQVGETGGERSEYMEGAAGCSLLAQQQARV